ncbi:hypothetical protein P7D31_13545 [Enterococcus dongliensis]|nr:hypothetical protein [Enterococcus dongliensis]MDT2641122.1 hypothetical protein [Enterococcus dongliensis]MDT2670517.1 hypothetical protein [Enterococcus dongliensis]MDT2702268.1 hypothetical protein [Enterococcus dongliensis]
MLKGVTILYNSFWWAMTLALICFSNEWLQMRINTGWIFFGSWLLLVLLLTRFMTRHLYLISGQFAFFNAVGCFALSIFVIGWQRLSIVPASLIREGLHQTTLPFSVINQVLSIWLVVGGGLIAVSNFRSRSTE